MDNTFFKWICRVKHPEDRIGCGDFGIIGYNRRTGATCFWDDVDGKLSETDPDVRNPPRLLPEITLVRFNAEDGEYEKISKARLKNYKDVFYQVGNGAIGCTRCHDADPFIKTPYLDNVYTDGAWADRSAPYMLLREGPRPLGGGPGPLLPGLEDTYAPTRDGQRPTKRYTAVDEDDVRCLGCHNIADGLGSCGAFLKDAVGLDPSMSLRPTLTWMPPGVGLRTHEIDQVEEWVGVADAA